MRVAVVRDRLGGRRDALAAGLGRDRDLGHLVTGLLGEGEAHPAEAGVGALDARDDGVVVGLRRVVLPGGLDLVLGDRALLERGPR